jgi:hypothetical protein
LPLLPFADELQRGVPVVSSPELGVGGGLWLLLGLFSGPMLLGDVVEPLVLAWSDRVDRRRALRWARPGRWRSSR